MTEWIDEGAMVWLGEAHYDEETVLVFHQGIGTAELREGLTARHRRPFAYCPEAPPGGWGVVVHPMHDPARDDYGDIDYRGLCPPGAQLMVFVPKPCAVKGHAPKAFHYRDGEIVSCIDYEAPEETSEYWPSEMAPLIAAAGLDEEDEEYHRTLTRLIRDHLGLTEPDPAACTVDREAIAAYHHRPPGPA
ncbi:hypothetical protein AB0G74_10800 [Streptomyces sp. NPDC020875]|uniref:hypothetical protein n=1 Tax=Streptomyces sp. NPDC020875 TaxID=3154898 RepID=UPI0033C37446